MRRARFFPRYALYRRATILLACAVFILMTASATGAQSGRRVPKAKPSEGVQPPANPEPPLAPPEEKPDAPKTSLLIVHYMPNIAATSYYTDYVKQGCAERLKESALVKVSVGGEMNRKEAQDRAKAGPEPYVVWFQLESDYGDPGSIHPADAYRLIVNYIVYKPETGKVQTQGRVYQRQRGSLPLPRNRFPEQTLREAGREMADRIFDSLNLLKPSSRRI